MSVRRDQEIAQHVRDLMAMGDTRWRKLAIEHLKKMMDQDDGAAKVARVVKVLSEKAKK